VTLSDAVIAGDTISFAVEILEGTLPARGGPNTLFVDVIGMPLTPLSVAGVRRRTRRRSLAVGMVVGASVGHASAQQSADQAAAAADRAASSAQDAADAAASPSVEQQLTEMKDMLDKGLITQQDYDAKKKQLFGKM
jgi:hypothetical protein